MVPTRTYEQNELTKTIVSALKRAIGQIKPFAAFEHREPQKAQLLEYQSLLERIEKEHLDLRMSSRLE